MFSVILLLKFVIIFLYLIRIRNGLTEAIEIVRSTLMSNYAVSNHFLVLNLSSVGNRPVSGTIHINRPGVSGTININRPGVSGTININRPGVSGTIKINRPGVSGTIKMTNIM